MSYINSDLLGNFDYPKGSETYHYYDAPLMFSVRDKEGKIYVFNVLDRDGTHSDYYEDFIVALVSEEQLLKLEDNVTPIQQFFQEAELLYFHKETQNNTNQTILLPKSIQDFLSLCKEGMCLYYKDV